MPGPIDIPGWTGGGDDGNGDDGDLFMGLGDKVPDKFKKMITPRIDVEDPFEQMGFEKEFKKMVDEYRKGGHNGINEAKGEMNVFYLSSTDTYPGFDEGDVPSYVGNQYKENPDDPLETPVKVIHLGNINQGSTKAVEDLLDASGLEHRTFTVGGKHARIVVFLGK